jgi:transketolase
MNSVDLRTINAIRFLSADMVERAGAGSAGTGMGSAAIAYSLFSNHLKFDPENPSWENRDRFIMASEQGGPLLYALLHLFTGSISIEELKRFGQWEANMPVYPEKDTRRGVEATIGQYGQAIANAVGMALAEKQLAERFNKPGYDVISHYTYVLASDESMMNGNASEACAVAGKLKLGNLIVLYEDDGMTPEGSSAEMYPEDIRMRFKAMGWQVQDVRDGNDPAAIGNAISQAKRIHGKPALICIKVQTGYGCPGKANTREALTGPLGRASVSKARENLRWTYGNFVVPDDVRSRINEIIGVKSREALKWRNLSEGYKNDFPELSDELKCWYGGKHLRNIDVEGLYKNGKDKGSTMESSRKILDIFMEGIGCLMTGFSETAGFEVTEAESGNIRSSNMKTLKLGCRVNALGGIANGAALHGGIKYISIARASSGYDLLPVMKLSAMMKLDNVFVLTDDSLSLGELGPAGRALEIQELMEGIAGLVIFRPGDAVETASAWIKAMESVTGPTVIMVSRMSASLLKGSSKEAEKGGYILAKETSKKPDLIIAATGYEAGIALKARKILIEKGMDVRVVSIPSKGLFLAQSKEYVDEVLAKDIKKRMAVEAGSPSRWQWFLGKKGRFAISSECSGTGPSQTLLKKCGLTPEKVAEEALKLLK